MGKVSNAILMLKILSTGKKYKIKELADLLEVSPRMVRSYKDDLEKAGIYIDTIFGADGGYIYKKQENYEFGFNISDLKILEKLRLEKNNISEKELKRLDYIIDKIRFLVIISQTKIDNATINQEKLDLILSSMSEKKFLKIKKDQKHSITFLPIYYNLYRNSYFFTGFVEEYNELRTYELEEIKFL